MLKDILNEKNISLYSLSKNSGVPYSTLSDIIKGKTDIKDTSARVLYALSKALSVPMDELYGCNDQAETLYIYNKGRRITIEYGREKISYLGPKNLLALKELLYLSPEMVAHILTYYINDGVIETEEEFYDLGDLFSENKMAVPHLTGENIHIGSPDQSQKDSLIDSAIMVSDHLAILPSNITGQDDTVLLINVSRPMNRAHIRLTDYAVLLSNMKTGMEERAIDAVKRNISIIRPELEKRRKHA